MLNNGLNPNLCDFKGISLLYLCSQLDKSAEVDLILDLGIDPQQLNVHGETPLITEFIVQGGHYIDNND